MLLTACGAIIPPEKNRRGGSSDDEESEKEDLQVGSKSTWANYISKNSRNAPNKDDSDEEFDL